MQVKMDVGIMGNQGKRSKQQPRRNVRSLDQFIKLLNQRSLAPQIRDEIIKMARNYPEAALDYLYSNLSQIVQQHGNKLAANANMTEPIQIEEPIISSPLPPIKRKALFDKVEEQETIRELSKSELPKNVLPPLPPKPEPPKSMEEIQHILMQNALNAIDPEKRKREKNNDY